MPERCNDVSRLLLVISISVVLRRGGKGEEGQSKLLVKTDVLFLFLSIQDLKSSSHSLRDLLWTKF